MCEICDGDRGAGDNSLRDFGPDATNERRERKAFESSEVGVGLWYRAVFSALMLDPRINFHTPQANTHFRTRGCNAHSLVVFVSKDTRHRLGREVRTFSYCCFRKVHCVLEDDNMNQCSSELGRQRN
jgi:hypothetical protein